MASFLTLAQALFFHYFSDFSLVVPRFLEK
jgi:hypothetical protein